MIRATFTNATQSFKEICEHCGEEVTTLHVSDIIQKPNNNNGLTLRIKDKDNNLVEVRDPQKIINEVSESYISKGLLDESEARSAFRSKKMKYGLRPEAMCSQSIDTIAGTTSSFCYKTDNTRFLAKFSSSFHDASEVLTNATGSKVGVDRKGNIIRMKASKNINIATGIPEPDVEIKYKGPLNTLWFRALKPDVQSRYIKGAQACDAYVKQYGKEAKDMTVVARYKDVKSFIADVESNRGCRI